MISLALACTADQLDALSAELHERGTLGILETSTGVRAWFADSNGLDDLIARFDGEVCEEEPADWVRRTQQSFPALAIGRRWWLAPAWNHEPTPEGRIRLEITPGMACGTGWHACTQLCLEAMERHVRAGDRVLDVGTGSGILSLAARLLGARSVFACDIDEDAARVAREHVRVFVGSADAVRSGAADVLVANISERAVTALEAEFRRAATRVLIVSGFDAPVTLTGAIETSERNGWRCVVVGMGHGAR